MLLLARVQLQPQCVEPVRGECLQQGLGVRNVLRKAVSTFGTGFGIGQVGHVQCAAQGGHGIFQRLPMPLLGRHVFTAGLNTHHTNACDVQVRGGQQAAFALPVQGFITESKVLPGFQGEV